MYTCMQGKPKYPIFIRHIVCFRFILKQDFSITNYSIYGRPLPVFSMVGYLFEEK